VSRDAGVVDIGTFSQPPDAACDHGRSTRARMAVGLGWFR
jgi:hypothetical protein